MLLERPSLQRLLAVGALWLLPLLASASAAGAPDTRVATHTNPAAYSTTFTNRGAVLALWTPQEQCAHCSNDAAAAAGSTVDADAGSRGKDKDECTNMTLSATSFGSEGMTHTTLALPSGTNTLCKTEQQVCSSGHMTWNPPLLFGNFSVVAKWFPGDAVRNQRTIMSHAQPPASLLVLVGRHHDEMIVLSPQDGLETSTGFIGLDAPGNEASITMGFHGTGWLGGNNEGPHRYQHGAQRKRKRNGKRNGNARYSSCSTSVVPRWHFVVKHD